MFGGLWSRFKADGKSAHELPPPGAKCLNCETELTGRYCHECGQEYSDQHRSILHLAWESIEGMFHVDGRLWRTIPRLFVDPGRLSKEYFDGKRARHVPPFRTFLVSLLLFILAAEGVLHKWTHDLQHYGDHPAAAGGEHGETDKGTNVNVRLPDGKQIGMVKDGQLVKDPKAGPSVSVADHPPAPKRAGRPVQVTTPDGPKVGYMKDGKVVDAEGNVLADGIPTPGSIYSEVLKEGQAGENPEEFKAKVTWFEGQAKKVADNPSYFMMIAFGWGHRLAVLLLPIFAACLALMYFYRRRIFVYDHLIVSMNYLSFTFLSFAIALVMPGPVRGWALLIATLWSPVNLFMALRGAYGSGIISAFLKTSVLWVMTICLFLFLVLGLMAIGFTQI